MLKKATLSSALVLLLWAGAARSQVCNETQTLRTSACDDSGPVACTTKGSALTHVELDANMRNMLDLCDFVDATIPDASISGANERDEVCGTTDLDATCEINADVVDFADVLFSNTLAGNPALGADECWFASTATGGCFICEGSAADTSEQLYCFQDLNGADTTAVIVTEAGTQTLTNKTIDTASNTITVVEADISDLSHTTEVNDLSAAVTWANVPDANVTGSAERDEVCGTTDLSATCEINAGVIDQPDIDDTDTLGANPDNGANAVWFGTTGLIFEGATNNLIEGLLTAADPTTTDKTWTLPDETGTVCTTGSVCTGYEPAGTYSGVGTCTTQFVRALNDGAGPTCESIVDADVPDSITIDNATTAANLGADGVDALTEIAQGIKTAANDTDPLAVFTGGNPAGNRCVEINSSGQMLVAADTCANLGPGGTTTIDALGDAAGAGTVAIAENAQVWDWNTAATAAAFDGLTINLTNDASTDASTQQALVVARPASSGTATVEALVRVDNLDTDGAVTAGIVLSTAAGGMTVAIDASDTDLGDVIKTESGGLLSGADLDVLADGAVALASEVSGTLPVGNGGTGATSLTDGGILLGSGSGAVTALGVAANGEIPIGDGTTDPVLATISGTANEIEITNGAGSITVGIVTSPTLDGTNFTGIPDAGVDNNITIDHSSAGTLDLDQTVAPTVEGRIAWDATNDEVEIGDGASTQIFKPVNTFTSANFCTADTAANEIDCGTAGALADDDVSDDLITALSGVTTVTDGSYCQGGAGSSMDCDVTQANIPGADHLDAISEIAAGIKRGPDATDTHLLTTDVAAPGAARCLEMDTDGSVTLVADTCANLGPGGTTTIDALGDAAGIGAVQVGSDAEYGQTWTWNTPATTVGALDALSLVMDLDATSDAQTQHVLVVERSDGAGTTALEALVQINNNEVDAAVTDAIEITAAAGTITNALDLNDAQITNFAVTPNATLTMAELEFLDGGTRTDEALCTYETTGNELACDVNTEALLETALGSIDVVVVATDDITTANLMTILSDEGAATTVLQGDGSWAAVDLGGTGGSGDTSGDLDPDRIAGDSSDDNLLDAAAIADAYVLNSGDTLTGELVADDLGIEFTAGDALTDCTTFAATGGGIFFDDSEGIFKKCQDNVLTDLDTGGAEVNDLTASVTWANVPDANVSGADERDEVCGTTDLSAACEINTDVVDFADILYTNTLAGNPALGADECWFASTATGGCFICEGSAADTSEQLYCFQDLNGADTTAVIVTEAGTQTLTGKTIDATNTVTINASDITDQNAGTDVTADLEEEAHAAEHSADAADEIFGENLGTACTIGQVWASDGDGTASCSAAGAGDITDVFSCATGDCASITMAATDLLDMSGTDASTATEGLILPQHATACAGGTAEGQPCWEADANILHIGDGATIQDFPPASAISGDVTMSGTGAVTIAAGAVDEDMLAATLTFDATDFLDFSGIDASTTTEGLRLPQIGSACAAATAEGQICWDTVGDDLYVGDGASVVQINAGGGAFSDASDPIVQNTTTKDVVIGTAAVNTSKLTIDGDADQVQLSIQGNATQTNNLLSMEQSDGTEVVTIDNSGNVSATTFAADAAATPALDFDDSDDTGTIEGSINVNCPTANDCDMDFAVNSGADTETTVLKIDTTDAGATTIQMGTPGTNYVNVDEAGAMTAVGSASITATAAAADSITTTALDDAADTPAEGELLVVGQTTTQVQYIQLDFSKTMFDTGNLTATDDVRPVHIWGSAAIVTDVDCITAGGTSATITLEDGAGTDLVTGCVCATTLTNCSLGTATFTADEELDIDITAVSGSVTTLTFSVQYRYDL